MKRMLHVAWREFLATVGTKGFILGVLITPVLIGIMVVFLPMLLNEAPPKIDGQVAIVDPTGEVSAALAAYLAPEEIASRRDEFARQVEEAVPVSMQKLTGSTNKKVIDDAMGQAMDQALGSVPELDVLELSTGADVETEKEPLLEGTPQDGGRLALVVVHQNAVVKNPEGTLDEGYGNYDLFVREKLDDRLVDEIKDGLRQAIVEARARAQSLDPDEIAALTRIGRVRATTVSAEGERESNEVLNMLLPMSFMILLLISVMTGGQYLMTTTIEEKSSRVVEVLLSAVSPMELMTGKILGQLAVGFLVLGLYAGMGIAALVSFSLMGLLDLWLLIYMVIFYLIAYFVLASLMAAIGAAVNEMREAQTLMTPIMIVIMIPWMLWMPITRDPNSLFATITSLLPPINSFVMLLRMTSSTPPPMWQVWLSIAIGAVSVYVALWIAAKVFRIGILMHGKPPSFKTLVKWVRMA